MPAAPRHASGQVCEPTGASCECCYDKDKAECSYFWNHKTPEQEFVSHFHASLRPERPMPVLPYSYNISHALELYDVRLVRPEANLKSRTLSRSKSPG